MSGEVAQATDRQRPAPKFWQALVIGGLASLLLLVVTATGSRIATSRLERETLALAKRIERSTYETGEVAEQLARLQAHVTSSLLGPRDRRGMAAGNVADTRALLDDAVRELSQTLHPEEQRLWSRIRPEVERLERSLLGAFAATNLTPASTLLEREIAATARVHDLIEQLSVANELRLKDALQSAERGAARVRRVEVVLGGAVVLITSFIWVAVFRSLRRQARLLDEYMSRVESSNVDLEAFSYRLAHDLKNALAVLPLSVPSLRRLANDPPRVLAIADRIELSSHKMLEIIESLLDFSQGRTAPRAGANASVRQVLAAVLEDLAPSIEHLHVAVDTVVDDSTVRCAPGLLHVVLANLCGNAVKFLEGQTERHVRVSAHTDGSWCVLEIADTGPGIPHAAQPRIFEPFYRVAGTLPPGTGIGLSTVRRIVDAHGGSVSVDSSEGRGSRFEVRLPLGDPSRNDPSPGARAAADRARTSPV